ncbi:unnamed protein product [Ixodes hexagonus]
MEKGKQFSKFSDLSAALAEYQDTNFVQFWTSSSRTIAGARKKGVKRHLNDDLVYTEITYSCTHGGRKYKSQSTGARPNQRTFKTDCTAMIKVVASKDGEHLVVSVMDDQHQHPVSEASTSFFTAYYRQLPKQRRLTGNTHRTVRKVLALRANARQSGSVLLLRDLHNTASTMTLEQLQSSSLDAVAEQVRRTGGTMEVLATQDSVLVGVFYQDEEMKRAFANYPEVLFVDAVRKTNDKRMLLYVVAAENSNGEAEVAALLLCTGEDEDTVRAVFQRLQVHSEHTDKTRTVVTDKDCVEWKVLGEIFPSAERVVCPFLALRKFRKEVTTDKMGINSQQRTDLLKIFRNMCHASGEEDYTKQLEDLEAAPFPKVLAYFLANWHIVREEWVQGLQRTARLGNRRTNRVEALHQKMMHVVLRYETLPQLFEDLMVLTTGLRIERDQRAVTALMKAPAVPNGTDDELEFCKLLTPYAFKAVSKQLDASKTMTHVEDLTASCQACTCRVARSLQLPCRHIFYQRRQSGLPPFFREAIADRWTREYYQRACRLFAGCDEVSESVELCGTLATGGKAPSQVQKYREASTLLLQLSARMSELPARKYERYLDVIKQLKAAIETGQDVHLADIDPDSEPNLPWG